MPEILIAARTFDRFLPLTLEYLNARSIDYPMDARLPSGLRVRRVEREDVKILWHIFVRKCYAISGNESVILDLGANVGFFAVCRKPPHPPYTSTASSQFQTHFDD